MEFPPEVEARFKRIEDALLVSIEMQNRHEARTREDVDRLESIQDAMARWMERLAARQDEYEEKMNALIDAQIRADERQARAEERQARAEERQARAEENFEKLRQALADLARTVELYLKSRTNGNN
jgi:uncharacterized coiled-coil DUF342 family protein